MPTSSFPTLEGYERSLVTTLRGWSPRQRRALAAAMAERWFPAYRAFSKNEKWGDPKPLRQALDLAWAGARGGRVDAAEVSRLTRAIDAVTPHMDDFEAHEALCATAAATYALRASVTDDNVVDAQQATLSGFYGVEPAWDMEEDETPKLWKRPAVRTELAKQLAVLARVEAMRTTLDAASLEAASLDALRAGMSDRDVVGRIPKPPKPAAGPPAHANEVIFDNHRRRTEAGLKRPNDNAAFMGVEQATVVEWLVRYSLRKQSLTGENGRLADTVGVAAVVTRNRARDGAVTALPDWSDDTREHVELIYANRYNPALEVRTLDAPHAYGPSLRRLWVEARDAGASADDAWRRVLAWAHDRPDAWAREDERRSKRGKAAHAAAVGARLARPIAWQTTGDVDVPWVADVDGQRWTVRLGDYPEAPMYALVVDGVEQGTFHDWPTTWTRPVPG
jgi:uncharacterized protein YjaG (DUF416 family)